MKPEQSVDTPPLLQVKDLVVEYSAGRYSSVQAVSGVNFDILPGETFGLVGESGCGKSSIARAIMQLPPPTSGQLHLNGGEITSVGKGKLRQLRRHFQMVFQDPVASLNPRRKIGKSIEAPLNELASLSKEDRRQRAHELLEVVGLDPMRYYDRFPFQLSGGQCQRVSIARALILQPELLICDEPVSSLDVSIQAQIINLLSDLKAARNLSMLFISHDLAVVKNICDRVAVMYLGHICELAPAETLYRQPRHPYTRALLAAIPRPDPARQTLRSNLLSGELPSATDPPSGCRFRTRCPRAQMVCSEHLPTLQDVGAGHQVACHNPHLDPQEGGAV